MQGDFRRNIVALGPPLGTGYLCGIGALEVEHYAHIGPATHHAQMESAFHGRLDAVQYGTVADAANADLALRERGHPRTGAADQGLVAYTPRKITAAANGQACFSYAVCLTYKFSDVFFLYHIYLGGFYKLVFSFISGSILCSAAFCLFSCIFLLRKSRKTVTG